MHPGVNERRGPRLARLLRSVPAAMVLALLAAAPAHAVATVAADTTRSSSGDPLAPGRSTSLTAGGFGTTTLLRFDVRGLGAAPQRAILRLRVTAATVESIAVRVLPPAFGEDDGSPAQLAPEPTVVDTASGATAGSWAEWDVTSAVHGDGDLGLELSGPILDPVSFSSREGPDAPQLVITPDDARAVTLAGLLDPAAAETFVADVRDNTGDALDGLDVIAAPAGQGIPGRYIGVYHALESATFVAKLATSDDLTTWTHRADLDAHASQPTLAALPDGGFVLAVERDTPDEQYVSKSHLVVRHFAGWEALVAGSFDREADLPRTLAATAEGTPALDVQSWNGPDASQIAISFHYLKNISVDRQAGGVLTNFAAAGWAPQPDAPVNSRFIGLGTRGNLGDRANLSYEGHPFTILEAQAVKTDFATWRWYLYDRERGEARLLPVRGPAGSYALGNPTVRALTGPAGEPLLFLSGYAFWQGAGPGEAGQFIALRRAVTAAPAAPEPVPAAPPAAPVAAAPAAAPPPPPAPPVAADTTAPAATLAGRAQRLTGSVAVRIACPDEACLARTTGTVRVPKTGRAAARTFTLKATTATIAEGASASVRLALGPSARAAVRRALRAGRRVGAEVRASVADRAGNTRRLSRRVALKL